MYNLSEEELLELAKINSSPDQIYQRFLSEHFIFRISYVCLIFYAFSFFIYASFTTQKKSFPEDLEFINATYGDLLQLRLLVMVVAFLFVNFAYAYDKFFKLVVLSLLFLLSNYSIDMFFVFGRFYSELTVYGKIFWLSRPLVFLAIFGLLFFYDKPKRLN